MKFFYCPGAASNRGLCSHELKCIELVRERDSVAQNIRSIEVEDEIIDGVENSNLTVPINSRTEADLQDSFESKRPRRFFACRGEGHSVLNLVSSIRDILLNSGGETSRKVYCATDRELKCSKCGTVNEVQERKDCGKVSTRPFVLHTLHHVQYLSK